MEVENLLDELSGRLTRAKLHYPVAEPYLESLHKHFRFALLNPTEADIPKLLRKSRKWLVMNSLKHPQFVEHFQPMVRLIDEYRQS